MINAVELQVHIARDEESGRWYVAESEVPGLRLEADTASHLIERVSLCAGEMIALNMAEIIKTKRLGSTEGMTVRPVFDSPLELAA